MWGVSYSPDAFFANGYRLAEQAVRLGAEHYTMDVEMAAKRTRASRGLQPVIDGARAGGWSGAVNLNTMGPPVNVDVNDYEIDTDSILATGGGVLTQAYFNETDTFRPSLAVRYWTRVGVPRDRLNLTISLYPAEADKQKPGNKLTGEQWVPLLLEADAGRTISIFMAEAMTDDDLRALEQFTKAQPEPAIDVAANRAEALRVLGESIAFWQRTSPEDRVAIQRQTLAWRVLLMRSAGENQRRLKALLDELGAPEPEKAP